MWWENDFMELTTDTAPAVSNVAGAHYYSISQLARRLGCSIPSLYRWEKAGVIAAPQRLEIGGLSARIYSEEEAQIIAALVEPRITYGRILAPAGSKRQGR